MQACCGERGGAGAGPGLAPPSLVSSIRGSPPTPPTQLGYRGNALKMYGPHGAQYFSTLRMAIY